MFRIVLSALTGLTLVACQAGDFPTAGGGGAGPSAAGAKVAIRKSNSDSCGAADFGFLKGQPLANTFDLKMPSNTQYIGRNQKVEGTNANRLTIRVSKQSAAFAMMSADATIRDVFCG